MKDTTNILERAQLHKAEQIGRILACYGEQVKDITTPTLSQVDFEKAVKDGQIKFYLDDRIQKALVQAQDALKNVDTLQKSDLSGKIRDEFGCLLKVNVVFNNATKTVWVDCIDPLSKGYKDNAITRQLGLYKGEEGK